MNSPNPKQKHRGKRPGRGAGWVEMLQTKRDFMCRPWNTCIKEKRQENLFYTSNLKILHSLQVFILGTRHGVLHMKPTLYSSDRINVREKKNQARQVTRLPLPHILWKLSFLRLTIASNPAWFTRKALEAKAFVDHSAMAYGLKIFMAHLQVDLSPLAVRKTQLCYVKFRMTRDHSFAPVRSPKIWIKLHKLFQKPRNLFTSSHLRTTSQQANINCFRFLAGKLIC